MCILPGCGCNVLLQHLQPAPVWKLQRSHPQGQDVLTPWNCFPGQAHQRSPQKVWYALCSDFTFNKSGEICLSWHHYQLCSSWGSLFVHSPPWRTIHHVLYGEEVYALHQLFQRHASVSAASLTYRTLIKILLVGYFVICFVIWLTGRAERTALILRQPICKAVKNWTKPF